MKILNTVEQEAFDTPPVFNNLQRKRYFDFPSTILKLAKDLRSPTNQAYFLLGCGYFQASKKIFDARKYHQRDIDYVTRKLELSDIDISVYHTRTRLRHREQILSFYGFKSFDQAAKKLITQEIEPMVGSQLKPKLILLRIIDVLVREKIEIPDYFPLAEIILSAINDRKKVLTEIIETALTIDIKKLLDGFLVQSSSIEGEPSLSKTAVYRLTLLKKLSQSTKPSKIKKRVEDLKLIQGLYFKLQPVFDALALNHDGIRYYANSVIKSEIFQVSRRSDEDRYLHMIAFIGYQYYRLQDNLIDVLISSIKSYVSSSQREHKEKCYERRKQRNRAVSELLNYLDEDILNVLSDIRIIANSGQMKNKEKVNYIKSILEDPVENRLMSLKVELEVDLKEDDYYRILEEKSIRIQNRVSPIIKTISFQGEMGSEKLMAAIRFFIDREGAIDKTAPVDFLEPAEKDAIIDDGGKFRPSLYKAFLFIGVMGAIKSGVLNLKHSYKYRALDNYLIDREIWEQEKDILLERAELDAFKNPGEVLSVLDHELYAQYIKTNQNIREGCNPHVTFTKSEEIRIRTPKLDEDSDSGSLQEFFPERQYVSLLEVLSTVNRYSGFLDEFHHWQQRYNRVKPPDKIFFAGIIAMGCAIGIRKILRISRQISESDLEHSVNWYFSRGNTLAANDKIIKLIDRMELPSLYRRSMEYLHTSSDGQKFEVRADSLNANYSFKYFGKWQGVSVYSFIDERNLLWYSVVISSAERESAYVIDGLMHNDVIKSDIHSTDTHGYSEAIFGTMHLLGFSYAPRIKNIKRQRLYIFKSRKVFDRSQFKIAPTRYIDKKTIEDNWDDILRFIATIKLKKTTASDIFRRLNSYSKQHALYRAIKAFGQIIKSFFILRYIDDLELRQVIQKQLNKIESSHRFARAISVGNPKEFTEAEKEEQEIAEGCKRLIKNAIICWNYLYLSQKIAETDNQGDRDALIKAVTTGSIVSWRHINLLGEYDFSDEKLQDSIGIKPPKNLGILTG
jgi:TnpA family transposase